MADASAAVLDGFQIRSDVKVTSFPNRYEDERGADMWVWVMGLLPRTNMQPMTRHLATYDEVPSAVSR